MKDLFNLEGKVAIVTGGNGGIGFALAQALAEGGANVAIWGTNEEKSLKAKADLEKSGQRILASVVDVADAAAVKAGIGEILTEFGRLDTVVANAGISLSGTPMVEFSEESFDKVLDVNVLGSFLLFREACRHMIERAKAGDAGGSLVAISSISAIRGRPKSTAYTAAKAAVIGMVRSIAAEHGQYGIRANTILPGFIQTEINRHMWGLFTETILPRVPMGRMGQPRDFAGLIRYLASDASFYHTGDTFTLDGGMTLA